MGSGVFSLVWALEDETLGCRLCSAGCQAALTTEHLKWGLSGYLLSGPVWDGSCLSDTQRSSALQLALGSVWCGQGR